MTKLKNERTTARVAKIAAKVLAMDAGQFWTWMNSSVKAEGDIRALAASCLTQTEPKPKRKPARRTA